MGTITIWFTGLSGAGKSVIARSLENELVRRGKKVCVLDGDTVRDTLHTHLGFTPEDIRENNRLVAELAKANTSHADIVLVPLISPFRDSRALARKIIGDGFRELYVSCTEATRVARDPKGLYRKAREGVIRDLIGYGGAPYEPPEHPDLIVDTETESLEQITEKIVRTLV